jgi:hypothetical protein
MTEPQRKVHRKRHIVTPSNMAKHKTMKAGKLIQTISHQSIKGKAAEKWKVKALPSSANKSPSSTVLTRSASTSALNNSNASNKHDQESSGDNSPSKGSMKKGNNGSNGTKEKEEEMSISSNDEEKLPTPKTLDYAKEPSSRESPKELMDNEAMIDTMQQFYS